MVVTTFSSGGSGCGLDHTILDYTDKVSPFAITPTSLGHDNMGGAFVGDLGQGRGPGHVLWKAIWDSGSHYSPHPYHVVTYRWKDRGFVGPVIFKTKPMSPDPARVARKLGFPFSEGMSFTC